MTDSGTSLSRGVRIGYGLIVFAPKARRASVNAMLDASPAMREALPVACLDRRSRPAR